MSIVVNPAGALHPSCWKRKESDDDDEGVSNALPNKRTRTSYYVTLESESPIPTDEDDESIYSVQANETEYVRDTSDTSSHWNSSSEDGDTFHIEYDIAPSDHEMPFINDDYSSSDPEDLIAVGVLAAICDSDVGLADNSDADSRSSVDSEIGHADYWTCVQCNTSNNNPLFRYCERCYKERKNFFPPRPKRKRRRSRRQEAKKVTALTEEEKQDEQLDELISFDSGLGLSQRSKSSLTLELDTNKASNSCGDSDILTPTNSQETIASGSGSVTEESISQRLLQIGGGSPRPGSSQETPDFPQVEKTPVTSFENTDKLCVICTLNPKNGVFVHGGISHICCCYKCAIKVWKMNGKRCPICKRKVSQVLKAFYI